MRREPKFKLTPAGFCCNPECGAQLYLELMLSPDDEACYRCAPPDDGYRPPLVLLQGGQPLNDCVTTEEIASLCDEMEAKRLRVKAAKMEHNVFHCEEACCNPFSISFVSPEEVQRQQRLSDEGDVA